jgi:hypothetical protein
MRPQTKFIWRQFSSDSEDRLEGLKKSPWRILDYLRGFAVV